MSIFCKHKWSLMSETTTKSAVEIMRGCGITEAKGVHNITGRKFIQLVQCDKCGKLKRFVEEL